jgi:hypothetical protein
MIITALLGVAACVGTVEDNGNAGAADAGPGSGSPDANPDDPPDDAGPAAPDASPTGTTWKAILMTGDDSISAFDNAREAIKGLFEDEGVLDEHTIQLSRDSSEQINGVRSTSVANFDGAMMDLSAGDGDACVVFMTSHGSQSGFYIRDRTTLSPTTLNQILDDACGDLPTVALISACYSGVFVDPVKAPNRVILTAARSDRTSFGCSSEATYTYWDGCLISEWNTADTWEGLYANIVDCIEAKESLGGFTPSHPQGSFGQDVQGLRIFDR